MNRLVNEYFERMKDKSAAWQRDKDAREKKKEEIVEKFGWDSQELSDWYEEDKRKPYIFSSGMTKAMWAWQRTTGEVLEMNDFLWDKEVKDFLRTIEDAGISEFIYTNQSTAVMGNIHDFVNNGWVLKGTATVTKKSRWGDEPDKTVIGLRFVR